METLLEHLRDTFAPPAKLNMAEVNLRNRLRVHRWGQALLLWVALILVAVLAAATGVWRHYQFLGIEPWPPGLARTLAVTLIASALAGFVWRLLLSLELPKIPELDQLRDVHDRLLPGAVLVLRAEPAAVLPAADGWFLLVPAASVRRMPHAAVHTCPEPFRIPAWLAAHLAQIARHPPDLEPGDLQAVQAAFLPPGTENSPVPVTPLAVDF